MSRIGKLPITVPAGVEVKISDTNEITVKGKNGTLSRQLHPDMIVKLNDGVITVERPSEDKMHKSLHGLTRTLVNNMVIGVTEGFTKELEINGVGYRAAMQGKTLNLSLGYSHPVLYEAKEGVTIQTKSSLKVPTKKTLVQQQRRLESTDSLNHTRVRVLSTLMNTSDVKKVKQELRRNN
jgi:large subunit ribosomal protein L6